MSNIILDFGSGNTCLNDHKIVAKMIDKLDEAVKSKKTNHNITIKWQLFQEAGDNIPLLHEVFDTAYKLALSKGYNTTASVFDTDSLVFLSNYDVPFIKIANNPASYALIKHCPRSIPLLISYDTVNKLEFIQSHLLSHDKQCLCVSKYPAEISDYEELAGNKERLLALSDHTVGIDLYKKYVPYIWEKHFKLVDSAGKDAGDFAITPKELKEIL